MILLEVKDIEKTYTKKILSNINFTIKENEIIGIVGSSGSGKSVLLKILIGFIKPTKGIITKNASTGFSSQNNALYSALTPRENLEYFATMHGVTNKKEEITKIIKSLGLENYENEEVEHLSGGTKKRVDIACALLGNPKIIILDEPFNGLDNKRVNELIFLIKELYNNGKTIIVTSHLIEPIQDLCTRFLMVEEGNLKEISKKDLERVIR